jgi:sugar phosphate isomerase/epimerase
MAEMIRLAGEFKPKKLVLHPSSEPISDADREKRLLCAEESIGKLLPVAKEIGAQLCIENLPRTCLGRTSDEIRRLIEDYPEVMICFDSNHLLIEDHTSFFNNVGERIGTIHASDYDKTDERHWLMGKGIVDWPLFLKNLKYFGYEGVFMTEVKSGTPADVANAYKTVVCAE